MTKTMLWVAALAGMALLWTRPWDKQAPAQECPAGQVLNTQGQCTAIVDPWAAPAVPPPAGYVIDSSQTDRNNALSEQRWAAAKANMAADERALQLRQQLAENSRREQRAYEEAALLSRQAQETTVYNSVTIDTPITARHRDYDTGTRIIRDANSMPNVTTVQVAPDRVWDYSTGQYHWADEQADGSLQVRQGE